MDASYRLKIKIGVHEFEAEGPADVVNEQFQAFKDLISSASVMSASVSPSVSASPSATPSPSPAIDPIEIDNALTKIMKVDGRMISLTARVAAGDRLEALPAAAPCCDCGAPVLKQVNRRDLHSRGRCNGLPGPIPGWGTSLAPSTWYRLG